MAFAKIMIMGNLGKDAELRYTPSGKSVCEFSVAVSHSKPDGHGGWEDDGTDWYRVTVWGDAGERANEQLSKGSRVLVDGRLKMRTYETRDGRHGTSYDVTANNVYPLDRAARDDDEQAPRSASRASAPAAAPAADYGDLDDLPF